MRESVPGSRKSLVLEAKQIGTRGQRTQVAEREAIYVAGQGGRSTLGRGERDTGRAGRKAWGRGRPVGCAGCGLTGPPLLHVSIHDRGTSSAGRLGAGAARPSQEVAFRVAAEPDPKSGSGHCFRLTGLQRAPRRWLLLRRCLEPGLG